MEAGHAQHPPESPEGGPPEAVLRAASGDKELTVGDEKTALDWLLGATVALEYDLPVKFETPAGMKELVFHFHQVDDTRLNEIDGEHREGDGPFAKLDVAGFNAAVVAEAVDYFTDETGRRVAIKSQEFLGGIPSPELAVRVRFKKQPGLLQGVVDEVRDKAGFSADRVGTASRVLVEAGKDS